MERPDLSKMPKWVQAYVADLERQRNTAVKELQDWADTQTPQPLSVRELDTSVSPPRMITRYVEGRSLLAKWCGVWVDLTLGAHGVSINYGREGGNITDRVFLVPVAHQQFRIESPEEK